MSEALTANDLLPLVHKLDYGEQIRLAKLALGAAASRAADGDAYRAQTPDSDEFGDVDDSLAWESEGWDDVDAPR